MSDKAPAFQFYPKDYVMDEHVQLMSLEEEGAYLRLLCHSWLQGSIPADVPALAKICRVPPAKMARLWSGVKPCWKESGDGRLVNGRQERDRAKQVAYRQERSESGRRGNIAKRTLSERSAVETVDAQRTHSVLRTPSPSPSPETENERPLSVDSEKLPNGNGHERTEEERKAFADEVWSEFLKVSGQRGTRLMSPGEYETLRSWMDGGIPLRIVLRGLADTKGKGRMLGYYNSSVQAAYEYHRQAVPL